MNLRHFREWRRVGTDEDVLRTLKKLEIELHREAVRSDPGRLEELLHPDFREFARSGRRYSRDEVLAEFTSGEERLPSVLSEDFEVTRLSERIAMLTYTSAHADGSGRPYRHTLRSSTWVRTPGGWRMRFHQGTPVDEPTRAAWLAVDDYVADVFGLRDEVLERTLSRSRDAGLPEIQVSPAQGALLEVLARAVRARLVVEIGTLGGYGAIFLARGLVPGGRVVTLELDPAHAEVARANLADAGLADRVDVREGPALDSLARLRGELEEPVDLVFIDADKRTYPEYLAAVLPMCRTGALIVADNVVREGAVADESNRDPDIVGARQLNRAIADDDSLRGTVIQTVGVKGHDGLAIAVVTRSDPSESPGGQPPAPGVATE